jgi:hypothetical protein
MTILGLPASMFIIFVATVVAGSLGAIHYVVFHVILGRPFGDEDRAVEVRDPTGTTASRDRRGPSRFDRRGGHG